MYQAGFAAHCLRSYWYDELETAEEMGMPEGSAKLPA